MIRLSDSEAQIRAFVCKGFDEWRDENGMPVRAVGLYCCAWGGYLTLCFDRFELGEDAGENLPDYSHPAYRFLEFKDWKDEFEGRNDPFGEWRVESPDGALTEGDNASAAAYQEPFFQYLVSIAPSVVAGCLQPGEEQRVVVQMLDTDLLHASVVQGA